jgi:hypothetical protein
MARQSGTEMSLSWFPDMHRVCEQNCIQAGRHLGHWTHYIGIDKAIKITQRFVLRILQSSGQSSWLQIQRSGFDSRRYQIF